MDNYRKRYKVFIRWLGFSGVRTWVEKEWAGRIVTAPDSRAKHAASEFSLRDPPHLVIFEDMQGRREFFWSPAVKAP